LGARLRLRRSTEAEKSPHNNGKPCAIHVVVPPPDCISIKDWVARLDIRVFRDQFDIRKEHAVK
jgi:hypothetical protein